VASWGSNHSRGNDTQTTRWRQTAGQRAGSGGEAGTAPTVEHSQYFIYFPITLILFSSFNNWFKLGAFPKELDSHSSQCPGASPKKKINVAPD